MHHPHIGILLIHVKEVSWYMLPHGWTMKGCLLYDPVYGEIPIKKAEWWPKAGSGNECSLGEYFFSKTERDVVPQSYEHT